MLILESFWIFLGRTEVRKVLTADVRSRSVIISPRIKMLLPKTVITAGKSLTTVTSLLQQQYNDISVSKLLCVRVFSSVRALPSRNYRHGM